MIIAAVGLAGSGKTEVTRFFLDKGFSKVYFGDVTFDYMREHGITINERNEREVREMMRREHGMAAYAIFSFPKIQALINEGKDVLIESMYSWEEYLFLKKHLGEELKVVAIHASQAVRAKRLASRPLRPLTYDELRSRDASQIENLHQAGPIALAEFMVINEKDLAHLHAELEKIYSRLKNG